MSLDMSFGTPYDIIKVCQMAVLCMVMILVFIAVKCASTKTREYKLKNETFSGLFLKRFMI